MGDLENTKLKYFFYSDKFISLIGSIESVGKLSKEQVGLVRHCLALLLLGKLSQENLSIEIKNNCKLNEKEHTITLTIIQQKLLDPLKEALDAVYNGEPNNVGDIKAESIQPVSVPIEKPIEIQPITISTTQAVETASDPLDMFDKAKRDTGLKIESQNIQPILPPVVEENKKDISVTKINREVNSIRVNQAAVLEDSSTDNLKFQDSQSVERLSILLKAKPESPNPEDLNLYVPSPPEKAEEFKPLNPIETGNEIGDSKNEPLEITLTESPTVPILINSDTTEPKNSTMAENIAKSRLKFAQNGPQGITAEKSYGKLLGAMSQKPKNQPPIVQKLKETFEHPERYSAPKGPSKPKPKKYPLTDAAVQSNISVISSQEKSSNVAGNGIIQEEVEDDIINLAKNISRNKIAIVPDETPQGPIVYTKPVPKKDDPFANIAQDKKDFSDINKNSNIIDLSG